MHATTDRPPLPAPLVALRDRLRQGPADTYELRRDLRLSRAALDSRLRRLRASGFDIVSARQGNAPATYSLRCEPDEDTPRRCAHPDCDTILRSDAGATGRRFCAVHEPAPTAIDLLIAELELDLAADSDATAPDDEAFAGFHRVVFCVGERRQHAILQAVEGVRGGKHYGGTFFRLWLTAAEDDRRPSHAAEGIVRYVHGVIEVPNRMPALRVDEAVGCWVEGFPRPGELRRWDPMVPPGRYLDPDEAAACVSAYLGRDISAQEVLDAYRSGRVKTSTWPSPAEPEIWEGDLPEVVKVIEEEGGR